MPPDNSDNSLPYQEQLEGTLKIMIAPIIMVKLTNSLNCGLNVVKKILAVKGIENEIASNYRVVTIILSSRLYFESSLLLQTN